MEMETETETETETEPKTEMEMETEMETETETEVAERRVGDFNEQELANTAWAFATVGWLDTTMVSRMSRDVFEWIGGCEATRQIGEGLSSDFPIHVTSVLWAFNFAGVLEPQFAEPVREVLRIVGREMDPSRLGSHRMPRFREGFHSEAVEPYIELDVGDMMVI